jgi:hypothetical protein
MHETLRVMPVYRNLSLIFLVFVNTIGLLGLHSSMTDPRMAHPFFAALSYGIFTIVMGGMGWWLLLAYWKYRLIIQDDRITKVGIFTRKELRLGDVTEAHWRRPAGGGVLLVTPDVRMKIDFNEYTTEQRDALVRHFRAGLEPAIQQGWDLFAYKITTGEPKAYEPQPGDRWITRGRCDRVFFYLMIAGLLIGCLTSWLTGLWKHLFAPFPLLVPLWILLRFIIPKEGILDRPVTLDRTPGNSAAMNRVFLATVIIMGVIFWADRRFGESKMRNGLMISAFLVFLAYMMTEVFIKERASRRRDMQAAAAAAIARDEPSTGDTSRQ